MKRQSQNLFEFEKMVREGIASRDCKSNVGMEASANEKHGERTHKTSRF
jgi:hypothetical protein